MAGGIRGRPEIPDQFRAEAFQLRNWQKNICIKPALDSRSRRRLRCVHAARAFRTVPPYPLPRACR